MLQLPERLSMAPGVFPPTAALCAARLKLCAFVSLGLGIKH